MRTSWLEGSGGIVKVPKWGRFELTLETGRGYDNPYLQVRVRAKFVSPSGEEFEVEGFWDGGSTFKVRFAPTEEGRWRYEVRSNDPSMDGRRGEFVCVPSKGKGFVRTSRRFPGHFERADGTPFYYAGTSLSMFGGLHGAGLSGLPIERALELTGFKNGNFQRIVDERARQGFTALWTMGDLFAKPLFNARKQRNEGGPPFVGYDPRRINPEFFKWVDKRVEYANRKGLLVTMGLGWPDQGILRKIGLENLERAWRYVVARYAAFDVTWCLFGEFEEFGRNAVELTSHFGRLTKKFDPYGHPTTTHTVDSNNELAGEDWLDYIVHQSRNWNLIEYDWKFGKPIVNAEFYYENKTGRTFPRWSHIIANTERIRRAAWEIRMRGAYFVYEIWGLERDPWRLIRSDGERYVEILNRFFERKRFWLLEPRPEAVEGALCLADGAKEFVVYAPEGGEFSIRLPEGRYKARWLDPRTGRLSAPFVLLGGRRALRAPGESDWALDIRRAI